MAKARAQLVEMAKRNIAFARAGAQPLQPDMHRVPARRYTDGARWRLEMERVFRRVPLLLGFSCELRRPGEYKALTAAGAPVLLVRGDDGRARAFVNSCAHRGAQVAAEGSGRARRFVCPYHAWAYDLQGALRGVLDAADFGELRRAQHGLTPLPLWERAGLIWAALRPDAAVDFAAFIAGYDEVLGAFGFENWHLVSRREIAGPNWKIAYDGYLDFYHLPILHKETFGADFPNTAIYTAWGPHQRVAAPDAELCKLERLPEKEWPVWPLLAGVWTVFPHASIATFEAGGRGVLLSQLFPGAAPGESTTVQNYLMEKAPAGGADEKAAREQMDLLEYVVRAEDYATGLRQQRALAAHAARDLLFGRNEGGGQRFHRWLERLLAAEDDAALNAALRAGDPCPPATAIPAAKQAAK